MTTASMERAPTELRDVGRLLATSLGRLLLLADDVSAAFDQLAQADPDPAKISNMFLI